MDGAEKAGRAPGLLGGLVPNRLQPSTVTTRRAAEATANVVLQKDLHVQMGKRF